MKTKREQHVQQRRCPFSFLQVHSQYAEIAASNRLGNLSERFEYFPPYFSRLLPVTSALQLVKNVETDASLRPFSQPQGGRLG